MRLVVTMLVISIMQVSADGFAQKLTFGAEDATIQQIFREVRTQTGYDVFYLPEDIDPGTRLNVAFSNASLEEVISSCVKGLPLTFVIVDRTVVIMRQEDVDAAGKKLPSPPPQQQISGTVTDTLGVPLPGVSIMIKGDNRGIATDSEGKFFLPAVPREAILIVSLLGFETQEIPANEGTLHIRLRHAVSDLDQVVVIGYGTVAKRDLTGSVESIAPGELAKSAVSQLGQALAGRASGLMVQQTSGMPGQAPAIRIRGGNSINGDNAPLFVVDGFVSAMGAQDINPENIESVEILKDASATAIYGSRGANGVIIITTKRGTTDGKIHLHLKSLTGVQQIIKKYEMMDARQHAHYLNSYAEYRGLPPFVDNPGTLPYNTDWQNAMLRNALQQHHFISLNGGTEKLRFNTSVDYINQDGIIINSGFRRFNSNAKLDLRLSDAISSGANISFRNSRTKHVANVFKNVLDISPTLPVYNEDGSYNYLLSYDNPGIEILNPIEELKEYTNFDIQRLVALQAYIDVRLLDNLYFKSEVAYYWTGDKAHHYIPSTTLSGRLNLSTASLQNRQEQSVETVHTLRYSREVNENHRFNAVAGLSTISEREEMFLSQAKDIASDVLYYYNLGAGDPNQNVLASDYLDTRQFSFLGRLNYTLMDKYLFTVSGRYDGSSNFGASNRFAFFPSGAIAWRASEEGFIKHLNFFDNLKFRLTYGRTGNQAIRPYQTLSLLSPSIFPLGNQLSLGYRPLNIANPRLRWETVEQTDIGLDMSLIRNRLQITFDLYHKKTRDLLLSKSIPSTTGFTSMIDNIGSIENKGIELNARFAAIEKRNLTWGLGINFSINRNKILDLGDVDFIFPDDSRITNAKTDRSNILQKGSGVGTFYTYVSDGIFNSQQEIEAYPHISDSKPGSIRIKDINSDGIISEADKIITGNAQPDFIFGVTNDFTLFGNVNLSMIWQGSIGGDILNYDRYLFTTDISNVPVYMSDFWTPENKGSNIPAAGYSGLLTDNYIESGSYVRLKNLSLSYQLPARLASRLKAEAISFFISGQDLLTITNYSGINPEVNFFGDSNGILNADFNSYPTMRSVSMGISIKL